jgi:hypothetical protein
MEMEFGKTRVARKATIVLVAVMAVAGIASAAIVISNHLTGSTSVKQVEKYEMSWTNINPSSSVPGPQYLGKNVLSMYASESTIISEVWSGQYYGIGVRLHNPNTGGPTIYILSHLVVYAPSIPIAKIHIQYWTTAWIDLGLTDQGGGVYTADFGPSGGYPVAPDYDVTSYFLIMLDTVDYYDDATSYTMDVDIAAQVAGS